MFTTWFKTGFLLDHGLRCRLPVKVNVTSIAFCAVHALPLQTLHNQFPPCLITVFNSAFNVKFRNSVFTLVHFKNLQFNRHESKLLFRWLMILLMAINVESTISKKHRLFVTSRMRFRFAPFQNCFVFGPATFKAEKKSDRFCSMRLLNETVFTHEKPV